MLEACDIFSHLVTSPLLGKRTRSNQVGTREVIVQYVRGLGDEEGEADETMEKLSGLLRHPSHLPYAPEYLPASAGWVQITRSGPVLAYLIDDLSSTTRYLLLYFVALTTN